MRDLKHKAHAVLYQPTSSIQGPPLRTYWGGWVNPEWESNSNWFSNEWLVPCLCDIACIPYGDTQKDGSPDNTTFPIQIGRQEFPFIREEWH